MDEKKTFKIVLIFQNITFVSSKSNKCSLGDHKRLFSLNLYFNSVACVPENLGLLAKF